MIKNRFKFITKLREKKFSEKDIELAMFAYDLAKSAHRNMLRDGGERFFEHPRALVYILLDEIGSTNINEVIKLLLHDVGEDTAMFGSIKDSYQQFVRSATFRLTRAFNTDVASGVIHLTKPEVDNLYFKNKADVMNFYIAELVKYPTDFLLKMIDRLHNLRSLVKSDLKKINKQVKETREVLLPAFESVMLARETNGTFWHRCKTLHVKILNELSQLDDVMAA